MLNFLIELAFSDVFHTHTSSTVSRTNPTPIKSYTTNCALNDVKPPFAATFNSLAEWVASLSVKRFKAKSIKAYLTGVRSAHIDMGFDDSDVFRSARLKRSVTLTTAATDNKVCAVRTLKHQFQR